MKQHSMMRIVRENVDYPLYEGDKVDIKQVLEVEVFDPEGKSRYKFTRKSDEYTIRIGEELDS